MIESNKDNLENFFKRKAQNPDIEFVEEDWKQLEAQLDNEMPVLPIPWWNSLRKLWPVLIIALISIIGWYLYDPNDNPNLSESQVASDQLKGDPSQNTNNITFEAEDPKNMIDAKEFSSSAIEIKNEESDQTGEKVFLNSEVPNEINRDNVKENIPSENQFTEENKNQISGYVVSENGDEALRLSDASSLHFLQPIPPDFLISPVLFPSPNTTENKELEKKKSAKKSSFIIGIGYSPDFSTVGLDNYVAPGSRWKLYLEYNFKGIIGLSSGVEWVNNKYEAYGDEYHAPQRYWYNGIVADEAYGECIMIDIPLNLRVQAFSKGRHQFFVSGGASTYFLMKEDYFFSYEQNDPSLPDHWGTDKMSVYPFGIINLSIGYEYLFKSRGSVQLEPYIKIPTKGIGWGNVDLYTIGAYISYRYRLGKR